MALSKDGRFYVASGWKPKSGTQTRTAEHEKAMRDIKALFGNTVATKESPGKEAAIPEESKEAKAMRVLAKMAYRHGYDTQAVINYHIRESDILGFAEESEGWASENVRHTGSFGHYTRG
jgi:hypothetical protein